MADHRRIWLQHPDDADDSMGRLWCKDKVWPDEPGDSEPTEYVRADITIALVDALDVARSQLVTLGGEPTVVDGEVYGDAIQHAVLGVIDAALAKARGEA